MKIISWNVNGIRAVMNKGFNDFIETHAPDILCLQETKAQDDQVLDTLKHLVGYHLYYNSAERKGYSGTAILSKEKPLDVRMVIGEEVHDKEGRVVTAEYPGYYVVCVYVPNSGEALARLDYRATWDNAFALFLDGLQKKKPVIVLGDFNVAHEAIDLARPKENYNKAAGYTQKEIDGLDTILSKGFIDSYRTKYPEEVKYSWWSYRMNARERNIGWRIDYALVSNQLENFLNDAFILNEVKGSDHCPVGVLLKI